MPGTAVSRRAGLRRSPAAVIAAVTALAALAWGACARADTVPGLPAGVAAAALESEPSLPVPHGWPFPDAFSRTSGTGRMIGGALEWTDWVDDAYGASSPEGLPLNSITTSADSLSPAQGDYVYPSGAADNDGADIFRAAVGVTRTATIWRVDWNTLADPSVPIAEWTFDTDDNARTGASRWPAGANVSSPGIEKALVVSAKGAWLINAVSGATIAHFPTTVDPTAQSFVVSVPRKVMPVRGRWRIRLAAGLADAAGDGFAVPSLSGGVQASASAPRVYNITFRTAAQEPAIFTNGRTDGLVARLRKVLQGSPILAAYGSDGITSLVTGNFWGEDDQADTLAGGNVSKFSHVITWRGLAAHERTSPPLVKGWSDRWYVTDLNLGQGTSSASDANPAYLERVVPYAVYVPPDYTGRRFLPLTWMLHFADGNYNSYGANNPRLVQEECRARDSICASPEGFGGDGLWEGDAEHDFWQVWRQVALAYKVDSDRTVMSGYSMGGLASFVLPATYPSVFSESLPLDGGFDGGCTTAPGATAEFDIAAATDRTHNVRWVPYVISDSYTDELSPYPVELLEIDRFEAATDRFTFFSTSTPEHITTDTTDGFSTQVAALHGTPAAAADPGTIDYTWCPGVVDPALGLGPTSVYWLSGLSERSTSSGATSRVIADDGAIPEPAQAEQLSATVVDPPDALPMQETIGSWRPGPDPPRTATLQLTLSNVAALALDTAAARLPSATATIDSDGPSTLTLTHLAPGTVVHGPAGTVHAAANGSATIALPQGVSTVSWAPPPPRCRSHCRFPGCPDACPP